MTASPSLNVPTGTSHADCVEQPGLVEASVLESRESRGVELDPPAGRRLGECRLDRWHRGRATSGRARRGSAREMCRSRTRSTRPRPRAPRSQGSRPFRRDAATNQIKRPKLKDGVLSIEGSKRSDRLALRLQAGNPGVLELDVGDDGYADFAIARDRIGRIDLDAEQGDDLVRIDESNGADQRHPDDDRRWSRKRQPGRRLGRRVAARQRRKRLHRRKPWQRRGVHGCRRRHLRLGSRRRQRRRRGPGRR